VPVTKRTRTVAAPAQEIWRVVADPHHLPRWWPRVRRVEAASSERWTQVLLTAKGRAVRADFRLAAADEPHLYAWEQDLAGTPFERLMAQAHTEVELEPRGDEQTEVAITLTQKLRGWSRFGPFLFRRAARRQLDEALETLEQVCARPA
jgi:uncharacterized protein YndB with AHSA1/START domain